MNAQAEEAEEAERDGELGGLVIGGTAASASFYAATVASTAMFLAGCPDHEDPFDGPDCTHAAPAGFIPVAGPWIVVASNGDRQLEQMVFASLGTGQLVGAVLLVTGLALPGPSESDAPVVAPWLASDHAGLAMSGRW